MDYLSVCSGIEAASVAWQHLGWNPVGFAEIAAFPRAVLEHRHPGVPLHDDFTRLIDEPPACDLLVGGTPCQAFSIAGFRQSLGDDRGNLTLQFVRLLDAIDKARAARGQGPALALWENVPGVLSTKDNAFGCFLGALVGEPDPLQPTGKKWPNAGMVVGPARSVAWRTLDAQYFGLAQRRQRVFALIGPRDWPVASALFPIEEGLRRDTPPRREAGESVAGALAASIGQRGGTPDVGGACGHQLVASGVPPIASALRARDLTRGVDGDVTDTLILAFGGNNRSGAIDVAPALSAHSGPCGRMDFTVETFCVTGAVTHTLRAEGHDAMEDGTGRGTPIIPVAYRTSPNSGAWETGDCVDTLTTGTDRTSHIVGFTQNQRDEVQQTFLRHGMTVRRLTPRECERLQGFPDDYTLVPYRKKEAKDGPRYKALGNSMAVPCMRWLGQRIEAVRRAGYAA